MLTSHERVIDKLYGHVDGDARDSHNGYLNFGLWGDEIHDYGSAAENLVRALGDRLHLTPGSRLIDAACGRGSQDFSLLRRYGEISIDAVDITRHHVDLARRRADAWPGPGRVTFHHASATQLPFPDRSFSHAMCLEAAHHFNTRWDFLAEAFRVLEPGGRLALAEIVLRRAPRSWAERSVLGAACALWRIPAANLVSCADYSARLRDVGFAVDSIEEVGALTFPGYYHEAVSPERRRELVKLRGWAGTAVGSLMAFSAFRVYEAGLVDYLLVSARKPLRTAGPDATVQ